MSFEITLGSLRANEMALVNAWGQESIVPMQAHLAEGTDCHYWLYHFDHVTVLRETWSLSRVTCHRRQNGLRAT